MPAGTRRAFSFQFASAGVAPHVYRLRTRAPRATELTKMLLNAAENEERERVIEALAGTVAAASADLAEGLAAFRDRRKPDFQGKGETE